MCVREREREREWVCGCVCVCVRLETGSERVVDYTSHVSVRTIHPLYVITMYVYVYLSVRLSVCDL